MFCIFFANGSRADKNKEDKKRGNHALFPLVCCLVVLKVVYYYFGFLFFCKCCTSIC